MDSEEAAAIATRATFAEKMTPLAGKITAYILDHQDDSASDFERDTNRWSCRAHRALTLTLTLTPTLTRTL